MVSHGVYPFFINGVPVKAYNKNLIETNTSIFEYDEECLKCKNEENIFILFVCIKHFSRAKNESL